MMISLMMFFVNFNFNPIKLIFYLLDNDQDFHLVVLFFVKYVKLMKSSYLEILTNLILYF
jgi:hypothetical protein